MPLYDVHLKVPVTYSTKVWANGEDHAFEMAADGMSIPYMGDDFSPDGEPELVSCVKVAEDRDGDSE